MQLRFASFRLDPESQRLWRGDQPVALTRKAFGVLHCLAERAGQLVTKDELLERVWSDTVVGDAVLKVCVREIRRALDDDPQEPRFIATAHRRGYRFVAPVEACEGPEPAASGGAEPPSWPTSDAPIAVVGREAPLAELRAALATARSGRRQVVFVTGEAGIGKTTLVDLFLTEIRREPGTWIARAQCAQQHGPGEAYMPLLDALGALCRGQDGKTLAAELARRAPTWLLQMPSLVAEAERARLLAQSLGATPERMLREMVETLGVLASRRLLVLALDDLHWSDPATLDLVSALARRREPARLLLVATYRPAEVILRQHPLRALKLDLQLHGACTELALEFLSEDEVREYLRARFADDTVADALVARVHRRSDGNPLFVATIAEHLLTSGVVVPAGDGAFRLASPLAGDDLEVPDSLRQMIEKRMERLLPADRSALEAASVAGVEFSTASVAAALEADLLDVEDVLADLARRGELVRGCGAEERPDGTVASRLRFVHTLYAELLYDGIAPARRAQLHRRLAAGDEASFGREAARHAAALALHYERGRDHARAVAHLRQAAENAARRSANAEAADLLSRALALLPRLGDDERVPLELAIRERRALLRHAVGDVEEAADELATLARRAREAGRVDLEVRALVHQATVVYLAQRAASAALFAQAQERARELPDPALAVHLKSFTAYGRLRARGFREQDRAACAEAVRVLAAAGERGLLVAHYGKSATFENVAGEYAAARRLADDGLALAVETGDLAEHLLCQYARAWALLHAGEWGEMQRGLGEEIELTERNRHPLWTAVYRLELAWLCIEAFAFERAERLCAEALACGREAGHALSRTLGSILLATAHLGRGDAGAAQQALREIEVLAGEGSEVEWPLRPRLELTRAELALAQGAAGRAREHADTLLELCSATGERTYRALARRVRALAALRAGAASDAAAEIELALAELAGGDGGSRSASACAATAPLAASRLHAVAADLCDARRRRADAKQHRAAASAIVLGLAGALDADDPLRAGLLGAEPVQRLLRAAEARAGRRSP